MIDRSALERISGIGGRALLGRMIDLFLDTVPQRLKAARAGACRRDIKAVGEAAHSLKSSAGNLGVTTLQELAAKVEELAESGQEEAIPPLLDRLEEIWMQVKLLFEEEKKELGS